MIWCEHHATLCPGKIRLIDFCRTSWLNSNSHFSRIEPPDVTGSSLTLGAAGSRRTVYLGDEISKLPDTTTQSTDPDLMGLSISNNNSSNSSSNNSSNNNHSTAHEQTPSTFLMYNRISNVIGDPKIGPSNQHSPNNSVLNDNASNGNGAKDRKKGDDHVWYEYGCV